MGSEFSAASGNGNGAGRMRIGDLAKKAGTTMRTIRYYEQLGLIRPAGRTKGGFRLYEEEELRKLKLIKSLQLLDIPLAQVKVFFDQRKPGWTGAEVAPPIRQILEAQLTHMEQRIVQYRTMQESLRQTLEILACCARCPREPGPAVCSICPAITARAEVPLHMQAVIEAF
jgi:MerR family transcriptional regulator, Zn(II)-responsive regulator of zntA